MPRLGEHGARAPKRAATPKLHGSRFAEQRGMDHLLALSQQAVDRKESHFQRLIQQRQAVQENAERAARERERKRKQEKKEKSGSLVRAC